MIRWDGYVHFVNKSHCDINIIVSHVNSSMILSTISKPTFKVTCKVYSTMLGVEPLVQLYPNQLSQKRPVISKA